jgi:hypothetical protein
MKKVIALFAVAFAAAPVYAGVWGEGNVDAEGTILNDDLEKASYVATGLSMGPEVGFNFGEEAYRFPLSGGDGEPTNGNTDEDGSILVEKGIRH